MERALVEPNDKLQLPAVSDREFSSRQDEGRAAATAGGPPGASAPRRKPGRPRLMSSEALLDRIRELAARGDGLFRIHRTDGDLYARARRQFGSWAAAVAAAGLDYGSALQRARDQSVRTRRQRKRKQDPRG